jgi:hypothetical protein
LGFGEGPISGEDLMGEAGEKAAAAAEAVICSPAIITELDRDKNGNIIDDDGCGDGRPVGRVFKGLVEKFRSFNRAKVFGGGTAMTVAAEIGLGKTRGHTLEGVFVSAIKTLQAKGINFGAHTAAGVVNPATQSGCGAIDGAPEIVKAAGAYEGGIKSGAQALGFDEAGLDPVFANYQAYAEEIKGQSYSGKIIADKIKSIGKVIKELTGGHKEAFIVINKVRGYTVDQKAVRAAAGGKLDVFAVDFWRLEDYSYKLYRDPAEQRQALGGMLVYTLATAGVLTRGDLPVYAVDAAPVREPIQA